MRKKEGEEVRNSSKRAVESCSAGGRKWEEGERSRVSSAVLCVCESVRLVKQRREVEREKRERKTN